MGYKVFTSGDVLTAADVNDYLMEQTVMVFASAAARTSALSAVLAEGLVSYLSDTDTLEYYDGSAWVAALRADGTLITSSSLKVDGNMETTAGSVVINDVSVDRNASNEMRLNVTNSADASTDSLRVVADTANELKLIGLPNHLEVANGLTGSERIRFDATSGSEYISFIVNSTEEGRFTKDGLRTSNAYFELRKSGSWSMTNADWTTLTWNSTEIYDSAGVHTSTNGYITTHVDGVWMFTCTALTDSTSTNYLRQLALATNNSPTDNTTERLATASYIATGAGRDYLTVSWVGYLPASTTVYTLGWQSSGATATWGISSRKDTNGFSGALLFAV